MPRPRDPDLDRWQWPDLLGYIVPYRREGRVTYAHHHYKTYRKSTGLLFEPRYKAIARKLHEQWIHEILLKDRGLLPEEQAARNDGPGSVVTAADLYLRAQKKTMPKNTENKFRQAIAAHFPTDLPLEHDVIHEALVLSINSSSYAPSTIRKHIVELRRFFLYCSRRRWIDRNPADLIDKPKQEERIVEVWRKDEIERIKSWLRKHSECTQVPWICLFLDWISVTAMRPSEILRMQWSHVSDLELQIPKTKTGKARALTLKTTERIAREHPKRAAWQAHMREILDELRRLYDDERDRLLEQPHGAPNWVEGFVWPWQELKTLRQEVKEARKALGLLDERRIYDLRATAEDYWVWELGFGLDQLCACAGHSPAVYQKYYKRRYGAEDRIRLLET